MELFPVNGSMFYVRLENLADDDFDTLFKYYEEHENDTDIDIPKEDEPDVTNIPHQVDLDRLLALLVQKHLRGMVGVRL
jgi:hypothetical protein